MGITSLDPNHPISNLQSSKYHHKNGSVIEEIDNIIKVYKNGYIERPLIVPNVACTLPSELNVTANDVVIDTLTNLWARIYVPNNNRRGKIPLLIYFHGGGFCVGSASWSCYHEFLSKLASKASCVIMSVNYRLAPENRLPKAYEDGFNSIMWVKKRTLFVSDEHKRWLNMCNLSSTYLIGDSAGANIAHNVCTRLMSQNNYDLIKPLCLKGIILIQPFFGGEIRTDSEKNLSQPSNSALNTSSSDTYWRLSLPIGANRDHPWCNPKLVGNNVPVSVPVMVCTSEMDILRDRNLEFCVARASAGIRVEKVISRGVGHAFQVLNNSQISKARTLELISHLKAFINQ